MECSTVPRAPCPPVVGAVDHGPPSRPAVVLVHETADPVNHGGFRKTVASGAARVVFNVEHSWKSPAITGPTSTMGEEEVCLCGTRARGRTGEVVATTDEACLCCACVVLGEHRIDVGGTFGGLSHESVSGHGTARARSHFDDDEASSAVVGSLVIDVGLMVGNVKAFDSSPLFKLLDRQSESE